MKEIVKTDLFEKCHNYTAPLEAKAAGLYPYFTEVESSQDTKVTINGKRLIMIGSNNYLGLTTHPKVKEAALNAIKKYGSGCSGSRFLNGNLDIHAELERRLADFTGKESALVFSTGFQTNLGTISTLVGKNDAVFIDRDDHASIVDGCRQCAGKVVRFRHNDMGDFERVAEEHRDTTGKLVVVDGVYSIGGDIVRLPELVKISKKNDIKVMVDDAHAIGVIGEKGNGTTSHFGLDGDVDIIMGTFSKSFGSLGGFIGGEEDVMRYIRHHCRTLIFSASMPPPAVAACLASLDIMENEPERRERLKQIYTRMKREFDNLGFNTLRSETAIIPILVGELGDTLKFWRALFDSGIYANAIIPPATPSNESLIRTSYMATHTDEEMDEVLDIFEKVGKKFGLI